MDLLALKNKYSKYGYPLMEDFNDVINAYNKYSLSNSELDYDWLKVRIGTFINTLKCYLSSGIISSNVFDEIRSEMWELLL